MATEDRHGRLLGRGLAYGRWIILLQILVIIALIFKFRLSTQIERDVLATKVKAEHTEMLTIEFMDKTISRWDTLRRDNPSVKVPVVKQPTP